VRLSWLLLLICISLPSAWAAKPNPPPLLLARVLDATTDPADYWVSEKYDGVRAFWDGRELRFRSGRRVPAPDWFVAGLPPQALDGELWLGRRRFDELSAIVRKEQPVAEEWRRVKYMIFELPDAAGTFTERIARMQAFVAASGNPQLHAAGQFRVADRKGLMRQLDEVVKGGGEGLMLHRAESQYSVGRSDDLLKLKPWQDAEATVVGHQPGRGRLTGVVGALLLETPDGRRFRLGSGLGDAERRNPPPLGTTITYRYTELTAAGLPRFPRYWRVRERF